MIGFSIVIFSFLESTFKHLTTNSSDLTIPSTQFSHPGPHLPQEFPLRNGPAGKFRNDS